MASDGGRWPWLVVLAIAAYVGCERRDNLARLDEALGRVQSLEFQAATLKIDVQANEGRIDDLETKAGETETKLDECDSRLNDLD